MICVSEGHCIHFQGSSPVIIKIVTKGIIYYPPYKPSNTYVLVLYALIIIIFIDASMSTFESL